MEVGSFIHGEEAEMDKGWGSFFIFVLVFLLGGVAAAQADFLSHPWAKDFAPFPVTKTVYTPPMWLNNCPVAVAGDSDVTTTTNCLPSLSGPMADHFDFDDERRIQIEMINTVVNSELPQSSITLEQAIAVAATKVQKAVGFGFPTTIFSYAVVQAPVPDKDDGVIFVEHLVLVVMFNTRAFVLDSMLDEILPWQYSPHRFDAIETNGQWHAVADDRDDPLAIALELYE